MAITITSVGMKEGAASGLAVDWEGGQFVIIVARMGLVACGIVDPSVAEKFGFAVAIARGTPERPLATPDDLLAATIVQVSPRAGELGVRAGMNGREALNLLS